MTDILDTLRSYPDDASIMMSKRVVADVVDEIARLRVERDALRELLREARAALKGTLGYGIDDRARRAGHAALASIDAALNKGGGDENS